VIPPGLPVVTVGKVTVVTVKVAVAVVLLSVMVAVQLVEPVFRTEDAPVLVTPDAAPRLSPVQLPPLTLNKVEEVKLPAVISVDHKVLVPVRVRVGVVEVLPEVGDMARVAVDTVMVVEMESVVSVMVKVPVPVPVVIVQVSAVVDVLVQLPPTRVTPVTPEVVKAVEPFHEVPLPVQASAIFVLWLAGTVVGEQVKLAPALANWANP
jgi:hypothetical protein